MLSRKDGKRMLPILLGVAVLAPLTPARAQWEIQTVEEGPSQLGSSLDLAYDPSGNPAIAYLGPFQVKKRPDSDKVKFAHFNGVSWDIEIAASGMVFYELAFSPLGAPSFVTGGPTFVSKSGSTWNNTSLDTSSADASLLYDNAGNPAVGYLRPAKKMQDPPPCLKLARRSNAGVWTKQVVDPNVGLYGRVAMALDPAGNLAIAYSYDTDGDRQKDTVKFAHWNGSSWDFEIVESGTAGYGTFVTLAYDPITALPSVAHLGAQTGYSHGPLRFLRKTESGSWECKDDIDLTTTDLRGCSLNYGPDGTAYLAYLAVVSDPAAPYPVRVARRDASSGAWTIELVDPGSSVTATFSPSLKIDGNGNLGLAYSQRTGTDLDARVKFARRQGP